MNDLIWVIIIASLFSFGIYEFVIHSPTWDECVKSHQEGMFMFGKGLSKAHEVCDQYVQVKNQWYKNGSMI